MKSKHPIRMEESFLNKNCWNILVSLEKYKGGLTWRRLQKRIGASDAVMGRALDFLKKNGLVVQEGKLYKKTIKENYYLDEYLFLNRINNMDTDKIFNLYPNIGLLFYGIEKKELNQKILKFSYKIENLHNQILKEVYSKRKKEMEKSYKKSMEIVNSKTTRNFLNINKSKIIKSLIGVSYCKRINNKPPSKDDVIYELGNRCDLILANPYLKKKEDINRLMEDIEFFLFMHHLLREIDFPYINIIPVTNTLFNAKKAYEFKNLKKIISTIKQNEELF